MLGDFKTDNLVSAVPLFAEPGHLALFAVSHAELRVVHEHLRHFPWFLSSLDLVDASDKSLERLAFVGRIGFLERPDGLDLAVLEHLNELGTLAADVFSLELQLVLLFVIVLDAVYGVNEVVGCIGEQLRVLQQSVNRALNAKRLLIHPLLEDLLPLLKRLHHLHLPQLPERDRIFMTVFESSIIWSYIIRGAWTQDPDAFFVFDECLPGLAEIGQLHQLLVLRGRFHVVVPRKFFRT